jgi:hypothetical protein
MVDVKIVTVNPYTTDVYVVEDNSTRKFRLTHNNIKKKIEKKRQHIKDMIWGIVLFALVAGVWGYILYDWLVKPVDGYWAPDYVNSAGELIDTDDDGDYYYWHQIEE